MGGCRVLPLAALLCCFLSWCLASMPSFFLPSCFLCCCLFLGHSRPCCPLLTLPPAHPAPCSPCASPCLPACLLCSLVHDIIGKHSDLMAMFNEFLMRCEVGPDDPYTRQYPRDRNRVSGESLRGDVTAEEWDGGCGRSKWQG